MPTETRNPVHERAWWHLYRLGQKSEEVATSLYALGVRGFRSHCNFCPLVRFLEKVMGGTWTVTKYGFGLEHFIPEPLPSACRIFVERFDGGAFSYLRDGE